MELITKNRATEYAGRFGVWKRKTAKCFLEMAKIVVEAKHGLDKDDFTEFTSLIGHSPSDSLISKLYRIGLQSELFEANIDLLPSSVTTLYALTTAGEGSLKRLFDEQKIHPGITGAEVERLVTLHKRSTPYRRSHPERRASKCEYIDLDVSIAEPESISLYVPSCIPDERLVQFLGKLELLTKIDGIRVHIPPTVRDRINSQAKDAPM